MKTILRFEKIKTFEHLNLSNAHINRYLETPNANPEIKNIHIFGSKNLVKTVKDRLQKNGIKPRKNSVLSVEALLTLSPEYFCEDKDQKKLTEFTKAAVIFLKENFGDNVISVDLHLDESNPHIHAHIIPLTNDGRLSARDMFNKITLKGFQKSYCEVMTKTLSKNFTYKEGSKAKHKDIKEFYTEINEQKKYKEEVVKLENKLMDEQDNNFALSNQIKRLENKIKVQQEEISALKKLVNKLKKFITKLKRTKKEQSSDPYELPELTIHNNPDIPKELNKKKRKNRPSI
ncbi:plasmid recombination protein [Vibrio parahaemolyticus]|nr:plasmid recombination protein [Vibrio parahaemolyticus]ELL4668383.1 plasmid recombination protein [Vibrio fluvialis]